MGRLLGNYIHASWQNYIDFGTDRYQTEREQVNAKLFQVHQEQIRARAHANRKIDIKNLEQQYNTRIQKQYDEFIKIKDKVNSTDQEAQIFMRALVEKLSPATWSAQVKADIVANLVWDKAKQTIVYKGQLSNPLASIGSSTLRPLVELKDKTGNDSSIRYINTIMTRATRLIAGIKKSELGDNAKRTYINKITQEVIMPLRKQEQFAERSQKEMQKIKKAGKQSYRYLGTIPDSLAQAYYWTLDEVAKAVGGIENINATLQERFAELIGNFIGEGAIAVGSNAVVSALKQLQGKGQISTTKVLDNRTAISFDVVEILKNQGYQLTKSGQFTDANNELQTLWTFDGIGDGRFQKADATFTLNVNGIDNTYGISIKNTDLTTHLNAQIENDWENFINIQSKSSLMLYLLGMNQSFPGIGNHYLNIFAEHEDLNGEVTELHKQALQSFGVAVFYSALSGDNQLRKGGRADVLAVYDKGQHGLHRVKLFDMASLVDIAIDNGIDSIARFSPALDIENLALANDFADEADTTRENINLRLARVLTEAKEKVIAAYISKATLNDILVKRSLT